MLSPSETKRHPEFFAFPAAERSDLDIRDIAFPLHRLAFGKGKV